MKSASKKQQNRGLIELTEWIPDGTIKKFKFGHSPLLVLVNQCITELEKMPEEPCQGPHCESWYGELCQFMGGNGCPAGRSVPTVVNEIVAIREVMEDRPGFNAFETLRQIADNSEFVLTPELRSWALGGTMQLKGFLSRVELRLKDDSHKTGPIMVGDTPYGWYTSTENHTDKEQALDAMFRIMELEDIAKVVSISKSNLNTKVSKRKYPGLGVNIIKLAVTEGPGKPKFGPLTNVAEEGTE